MTGAKINVASIGNVPSASHASSADTAIRATTAGNADHAASADKATEALTLGGLPSSSFAPATVVRSAHIEADGTVVASKSAGIKQSEVSVLTPGVYCINGLTPAPVTAVASITFGSGGDSRIYAETQTASPCQVEIETRENATTRQGENFAILLR